jgi:hypothetical protein
MSPRGLAALALLANLALLAPGARAANVMLAESAAACQAKDWSSIQSGDAVTAPEAICAKVGESYTRALTSSELDSLLEPDDWLKVPHDHLATYWRAGKCRTVSGTSTRLRCRGTSPRQGKCDGPYDSAAPSYECPPMTGEDVAHGVLWGVLGSLTAVFGLFVSIPKKR